MDNKEKEIKELSKEQLEKVTGGIFNSKIIMPARDDNHPYHKEPKDQQ